MDDSLDRLENEEGDEKEDEASAALSGPPPSTGLDQEEEEADWGGPPEVDIQDRRYKYAMTADQPLVHGPAGASSDLDAVFNQAVHERQQERQKERTAALLSRYEERDTESKRRRMLYRFRALVRLMVMVSRMSEYGADLFERLQGIERPVDTPPALPAFDLNQYRRLKKTLVPPQIKRLMGKPMWLRTDEELGLIYRTLCELPFFSKYSPATIRAMAPVINYVYVDPNRVVLRQGHMPLSFYFILSGSLLVHVEEKNHKGQPCTRQVGKLGPGNSFGELALIHNTPRTATVTTRYGSELLSIDREDFDLLLKDAAEHGWRAIFNAISQMDEFNNWTKAQMEHCSNNSKLIKYDNNKMIVGNVQGRPEHLYFIVDGKCRLVESLRVVACPNATSGVTFCPLPVEATSKKTVDNMLPWSNVVSRCLHIMTLVKGHYFGCGEDLVQRYVVAWGSVECLQIPHSYLKRHEHSNWVNLLEDRIQSTVPTHKFVFDDFVVRATWRAYKKDIFQHLIRHSRKPPQTSLADVPISIRQDEEVKNWNTIMMH